MNDFGQAMTVLGGVILVFAAALIAQSRRPRALGIPKERIDVISEEVAEIKASQAEITRRQGVADHDVKNIRTMIAALPSKDAVHKLELEVADLKGEIKVINSVTTSTARAVDRIESHLMSGKGVS